MERVTERSVLDVSDLPTVVFGSRNVVWLGTVLFMLIEGAMMAMLYASYFYYRTRSADWPPGVLPPHWSWGLANTVVFLVSLAPATWIRRCARSADTVGCQIGLLLLGLSALASIALRGLEFANLNCRWNANAYASTIWVLMGVHSAHLLTDTIETFVLAALAFTDRVDGTRFVDFDENSLYWYFVVGIGLATNFIVYGVSRLL